MSRVQLIDKLRQKGYKITPQRQEILDTLLDCGHKSAEEIHSQIQVKYPNISLDTVYRNLNTLKELGIIISVYFADGKQRFEFVDGEKHHHHLVCLKCGAFEEVDFCPLEFLDCKKLKDKNFQIERHNFEIFGYCSSCKHNRGGDSN